MKTHNLSDKLKHPVFKVAAQICKENHIEAYVIGGFVRDLLLERPSKDIDIVVVGDGVSNPQAGLMMLNELFNNEDFVNFVNDMIDSFEGSEVILDDELEEIEESEQQEPTVEDLLVEESPKPPKPVKRRTMNPETKKLPFNPESSPNSAESWSDNPEDYI